MIALSGTLHSAEGSEQVERYVLARMERADSSAPDRRGGPLTIVEAWRRYDDEQRLSAHVSERMLDLAGLRPGARVLDIATGRGEPALRAVAPVPPGGFVVGTDVSDEMLDFARARAARQRVTDLTLRVADGENLECRRHPYDRGR